MSDDTPPDWEKLFKEDPENAERIKAEYIDAQLVKMANGDEERLKILRAQQWRIDRTLEKYVDPLARLTKMQDLFYEGLYKFRNATQDLQQIAEALSGVTKEGYKPISSNIVKTKPLTDELTDNNNVVSLFKEKDE